MAGDLVQYELSGAVFSKWLIWGAVGTHKATQRANYIVGLKRVNPSLFVFFPVSFSVH